jgi:hypothetical protein
LDRYPQPLRERPPGKKKQQRCNYLDLFALEESFGCAIVLLFRLARGTGIVLVEAENLTVWERERREGHGTVEIEKRECERRGEWEGKGR